MNSYFHCFCFLLLILSSSSLSPSLIPLLTSLSPLSIYVSAYSVHCSLTVDNQIQAIYLGNTDVTKTIYFTSGTPQSLVSQAQMYDWTTAKRFSFSEPFVPTRISFLVNEEDTWGGSTSTSGFVMLCTSDNPSSSSIWSTYKTCWDTTDLVNCGPDRVWGGFACGSAGSSSPSLCPSNWWNTTSVTEMTAVRTTSGFTMTGSDRAKNQIWLPTTSRYIVIRKLFPSGITLDPDLLTETPSVCNDPTFTRSYAGRCYYFSLTDTAVVADRTKTWIAARNDCVSKGGTLASINSNDEQDYIYNSIGGVGCKSGAGTCWIGLFQAIDGGSYEYADGVPYAPLTSITTFSQNSGTCVSTSSSVTSWSDNDCSGTRAYMCVQSAKCKAGYKLLVAYTGWPNTSGLCQQCPAGSYRSGSDSIETSCRLCAAGYSGSKGATTSTCTAPCARGYYCPLGTATGSEIACPAGKYGISGSILRDSETSSCGVCPPGYYCLGGTSDPIKCPATRCSFEQSSTSSCSGSCPAGYYCPTGSACYGASKIDGNNQGLYECSYDPVTQTTSPNRYVCLSGSSTRSLVNSGYYSVGGTETTRTDVSQCPKGYYCVDGERIACTAGKYNSVLGSTSSSACQTCQAGYYCGSGSISSTQVPCSSVNDARPESYYCPAGSGSPQTVPDGYESLPRDGSPYLRESIQACPQDYICKYGVRSPRITWNTASCPSGIQNVTIPEMFPANTNVGFQAQVDFNSNLNSSLYTVTYSVNSNYHYRNDPNDLSACAPKTAAKNGNNLFVINSSTGVMTLSRSNLNYEVCLPIQDIRYDLVITATAVGESTTSVITCSLVVTVDDRNDNPIFVSTSMYRQIEERSDKNTPVQRCDTSAVSKYGCPVNQANLDPEILLVSEYYDEDYGSEVSYSITAGKYDHPALAADWDFKINQCTGLITLIKQRNIAYSASKPFYKLEIVATDDGNGKKFTSLSATAIMYVYITNKNDPPVMPDPNSISFTIYENSPVGTTTTPASLYNLITDADGDTIILSKESADFNAFDIVSNNIVVTQEGFNVINFESTKTSYKIELTAFDSLATTTQSYTINILDANDAPRFIGGTIFYLAENPTAGSIICRNALTTGTCTFDAQNPATHAITTQDDDTTLHPTDKTIYELRSHTNIFAINSTTGQITVVDGSSLDFENAALYKLAGGTGRGLKVTVRAYSSGFGNVYPLNQTYAEAAITIFLVDVNEPPAFPSGTPSLYILSKVWPNGSPLLISNSDYVFITAIDPDNADTELLDKPAPTQSLSYSLSPDSGNALDGSAFFTVTTGGDGKPKIAPKQKIELTDAFTSGCATARCFQLRIRADDNGGGSSFALKTVEIAVIETNSAPVFSSSTRSVSIDEDVSQVSQVLVTPSTSISATDSNGDSLTYTIIGGTGKNMFDIIAGDIVGSFKVVKLAGVKLDFESSNGNNFFLNVRVKDSGPSARIGSACSYSQSTGLPIDDCGYSTGLSPGGAICDQATLRCFERCSATASFTANQIANKTRVNGYFCNYSPETPLVTYPEVADLQIIIQVNDKNDNPIITSNTKDVYGNNVADPINDCVIVRSVVFNTPAITQTVINAGSVIVTDPDTYGGTYNPIITWKVGSLPSQDSDFWTHFSISSNGQVILSPSSGYLFENNIYNGSVRVEDGNTPVVGFHECRLQVKAILANTPPSLDDPATITLPENSEAGTIVLNRLGSSNAAIDPDAGDILTFSATESDLYTVSSTDGKIVLGSSPLDYEQSGLAPGHILEIIVQITDKYFASDVVTVRIQITDVNERPYIVSGPSPSFSFYENATAGQQIGSSLLSFVSDPDTQSSDANWRKLNLQIVSSSCLNCPFVLNPTTGILTVANGKTFDYETGTTSWNLEITVSDSATPTLTAITTLKVSLSLLNVNEPPVFDSSNSVLEITENDLGLSTAALLDLSTKASDPDSYDIGNLVFSIVSGFSSFYLENGKILKSNSIIDYETTRQYSLTIRVQDTMGLFAEKTYTVVVLNVPDVTITNVAKAVAGPLGTNTLSCSTSEQVVITGTNFGLKTPQPTEQATIVVTYRYTPSPTSSPVNVPVYTATNCSVTVSNTEIRCNTVAGVGASLKWAVSISISSLGVVNNTATTTASYLSYQGPTLSTVSASANDADARGGTSVTLTGTCLSKTSDNTVFASGSNVNKESYVQYCSKNGQSTNCYVPACVTASTGTTLICTLLPGLGASFSWTAKVAGQGVPSEISGGRYASPSISGISFNVIPTTGTFTSNLIITGSNFGDTNDVPDKVELVYRYTDTITGGAANIKYAVNGCSVTSAAGLRNQITCQSSAPGVGTGMSLLVTFFGQTNLENQVLMRFASPTVTSIGGSGTQEAATTGGQLVTFKGTNFGPICGDPSGVGCPTVYTTYASTSGIVYKPSCAVISHIRMVCTMVEGTGAGHVWTTTIGGQVASGTSTAGTTSYAKPTVGSYDGPGANKALTSGSQAVIISGSNFGPKDGALITARYGNENNPTEFNAGACNVTLAHIEIQCYTVPGAGADLSWKIVVDGQESVDELMDYGAPTILSFSGLPNSVSGDKEMDPDGSQTILITGYNFGPNIGTIRAPNHFPYLESVSYGPPTNPSAYEAKDCTVVDHFNIQCTTVPGLGVGLVWVVSIGGQTSAASSETTSYTPVTLTSLSKSTGLTNGGQLIRVIGSGFPLCDSNTDPKLYFNGKQISVVNVYDGNGVKLSAGSDLTHSKTCPIPTSTQMLEFSIPEMTVTDVATISLQYASTKLSSPVVALGGSLPFAYEPPSIEAVYAEPIENSDSIYLTIVGENFCASPACCKTIIDGAVVTPLEHGHSRIILVAESAGSVFVQCPSASSNKVGFNSFSPFILGTTPPLGTYRFDTQGIESFQIFGLYFGQNTPNVTISGKELLVLEHKVIDCFNTVGLPQTMIDYALEQTAVCYRTTVLSPEGQGINHPLVVRSGGQSSLPKDPRFDFLSYGAPEIYTVTGDGVVQLNPSRGGNQFVLTGKNFGLNGTVWIGGIDETELGLKCLINTYSHTQITCTVPPGEGASRDIMVVCENQQSNIPNDKIKYIPPIINSWIIDPPGVSLAALTQGGQVLRLTGSNFGRKVALKITFTDGVDFFNCEVISVENDYSETLCLTPEGEGTDWTIFADAGGQYSVSNVLFQYAPPQIYSISPLYGPTSGIGANGTQVYLEIFGINFGINRLRIEMDGRIVAQRALPSLLGNFTFTNHTYIKLPLPSFFGKERRIRVVVDSQYNNETNFYFDYELPQTSTIRTIVQDGSVGLNVRVQDIKNSGSFPRSAFNQNGGSLEDVISSFGPSRRRSLLSDAGGYGGWSSRNVSGSVDGYSACQGYFGFKNIFWQEKIDIGENGNFRRVYKYYSEGDCTSLIIQLQEEGTFADLGALNKDLFACGQRYRQDISRYDFTVFSGKLAANLQLDAACKPSSGQSWVVSSTATYLPNQFSSICDGLTQFILRDSNATMGAVKTPRFGMYVIADEQDLYMSKPSWLNVDKVDTADAFAFSDTPTATVIDPTVSEVISGPTDGCWLWEDIVAYNERVLAAIQNVGVTTIPRKCIKPAVVELQGGNYGTDDFDIANSLRVFFENPSSGDVFEAATTTSKGSHAETCPKTSCSQTHNKIRFRIPYGSGTGLRIRVVVGNQEQYVPNVTFSYSPPFLEEQIPGSVWNRRGFYPAAGGNQLIFRGTNFGAGSSDAGILIGGRVCTNATWQSGAQDENGQPYITCNAPRDVVGPKNVFICIANQTSVDQIFRKDADVLMNGDVLGAWKSGASTLGLHADLQSMATSRCSEGETGKLWELCRHCPTGAICQPTGSFQSPKAEVNFYRYDVSVYLASGELNPRAVERCAPEQWNVSLLLTYPDLVFRPTCEDFVGCVPTESCAGSNLCSVGYEYAYHSCVTARQSFASNNCSVSRNPYTSEYEGNHTECTGSTTPGEACTSDKPWECSMCTVKYDNNSNPFGVCECTLPTRCSLCTVGQYFRLNGECVKCPDSPVLLIIFFILAAIALVYAGYILQQKRFNLAFISIGVDYFQVLAIIATTNVQWPESLIAFYHFFSVFNFNIDITAPECLVPNLSYEVKWWLTQVMPLASFAILLMIHFLVTLQKAIKLGTQANYLSHVDTLIATGFTMMYYLYLSVTKRALDIFNCNPASPDDGYLYTTFISLDCDGGNLCRCGEPGGVQQRLEPLAIVFLLLYTLGFPAIILFIWYQNRRSMMVDQYFRACGFGDSRESNPHYDLRKRYSKLYYHFKPMYTFWILLILARKTGIAFAALMLRSNSVFQLAVVLLVLFTSFVAQVLYRPYMSTGERDLVVAELHILAERAEIEPELKIYAEVDKEVKAAEKLHDTEVRKQKEKEYGSISGAGLWGNRGKEMVPHVGPGSKTSHVKSGDHDRHSGLNKQKHHKGKSEATYLFDFNTVEMVLLGCAILITLAGLMFASGRFVGRADLEAQRDLITYLALFVIIFSLVYYFSVFLAELSPYSVGNCIQRLFMTRFIKQEAVVRTNSLTTTENPLFSQSGPQFGDTSELEGKLGQTAAELEMAERENRALREQLRDIKKKEQESAVAQRTGQSAPVQRQQQRKQFGQVKE